MRTAFLIDTNKKAPKEGLPVSLRVPPPGKWQLLIEGNSYMKNNNRIKLSFKGVVIEMLTNEKMASIITYGFCIGIGLFGLAAVLNAVAHLMHGF